MMSKVIIDKPQECKLKERKSSDHNTFIIDINTKTKYLEMVVNQSGKSVKKLTGRNTRSSCKTKYRIMTGTQKIAQNTLKKYTVLHEIATKSMGKYKISNNILNNKQIQEVRKSNKYQNTSTKRK